MTLPTFQNLAPERFTFWLPPAGASVSTGADSLPVPLPEFPLPVWREALDNVDVPSDAAIGQGVYDYLRQFPDCVGNALYAELLREAYPHFLADLAAHAVMLDAKQVEPAYVVRKLTCLKILALIEPDNRALLRQLSHGYFGLALEFSELACCREHLRMAMRYGQDLLALDGEDLQALALLAEIDLLLGDIPAARSKLHRLALLAGNPQDRARITRRIEEAAGYEHPSRALVDELETIAEAMQWHAAGDDTRASQLLDRIAEQGRLPVVLPSADFYCLLGICRAGCGNRAGAVVAFQQALTLEPEHTAVHAAIDAL